MTMKIIGRVELASDQASIEFTNIPQTYTDLLLLTSLRSNRSTGSYDLYKIQINGSNDLTSGRILEGNGSGVSTESRIEVGVEPISLDTANTFNNGSHYIPNYTSSNAKSFSGDSVAENNGTEAGLLITAGYSSSTSAISSLKLVCGSGSFVQYSSATLYGILKGTDGVTTVA